MIPGIELSHDNWRATTLGAVRVEGKASIDPRKTPDELFELYSVPSYDDRFPEIVTGSQIGSSKQIVEEGELLLCKINPRINRVWIVGNRSSYKKIASTEWIKFGKRQDLNQKFLAYYLSTAKFRDFLAQNVSGVGGSLMRIKASVFADYPFMMPPMDEQERIVAKIEQLFSELDAGAEGLKKAQAQLKHYRQSVLKHAFEGRLTNDNIKDGELPERWTSLALGTIADVSGGLTKNSKRGELPVERPFLRVANVYFDRLDLGEMHTIRLRETEVEKVELKEGDLLFVEGNGSVSQIGRVAVWKGDIPGCVHQNHLIKARFEGGLLPRFALYFFCSPVGRDRIRIQASSTSGLHTLSTGKVRGLELPVCPPDEQQRIVAALESRLSVCDKMQEAIETGLKQAEALQQSILKRAFEGKLV